MDHQSSCTHYLSPIRKPPIRYQLPFVKSGKRSRSRDVSMPELSRQIPANLSNYPTLTTPGLSIPPPPLPPRFRCSRSLPRRPGFLPHLEIIFNDRSLLLLLPLPSDERTATFHGLKQTVMTQDSPPLLFPSVQSIFPAENKIKRRGGREGGEGIGE